MTLRRPGRRSFLAGALGLAGTAWLPGAAFAAKMPKAVIEIVPFQTAPFPYTGIIPDTGLPFMDVEQNGRRGHTSGRGGLYWEDETYNDSGVLLHVPKGYDTARPGVLVIYFHGNNANLRDTVIGDQHVIDQFDASGINGLLVAPQFAVNALDSSAGKFWMPGGFAHFLDEVARHFTHDFKVPKLPVVLIAYSGGYDPVAYALDVGGADKRVAGVILLDALVAEDDRFEAFIRRYRRTSFFFSAYGDASRSENEGVIATLTRLGLTPQTDAPDNLKRGVVAFLATDADHNSFVTSAWVDNPLQWSLARIRL